VRIDEHRQEVTMVRRTIAQAMEQRGKIEGQQQALVARQEEWLRRVLHAQSLAEMRLTPP
jgi:hypothetical protein